MHIFGVLLLLAFVSACGKSNSDAGLPKESRRVLPADGSNIAGLYMAKFFTMNPGVNGTIPGSATIQRQRDSFMAYVRLFGGAPNAWHQQNVYEGTRCPNASDDHNGDGYIDIQEGNRVWGRVILPLDSNLKSQNAGRNVYPVADASGGYFYERETSFESLFNDLKSEDKNLDDHWVKLDPNQGLDFEGKVVVVMGTGSDVVFPDTVASADNRPVYQTLPIACGIFKRVTSIPGDPYDGEPEGPTGEVGPGPVSTPEPEEEIPVPVPETDSEDDSYGPVPGEEEEEDSEWYDRIIDWWRDRWDRERGPSRRQTFGDGDRGWWLF